MKREQNSKRVLARCLAREIKPEELSAIFGRGTSYGGTGGCIDGKSPDVTALDCCDGLDRYAC